jgi:hypothetical protein
MVEKGELGDPETAKQTLQEARNQIIDSVLDGEGGVRAILKQRYPDIEIEFKDLGSKGFGSDRDITVKVTGGKDANENARASVEGVREAYNKLRELGFEPDKALDSNFYTELHEGNITPTSKAEAAQILQDQSVTSLAEMRMNMSPEQWQAYKQQQLESLGLGKDATGVQDSSQAEARDRLQQQLQDAENLAAGLQDKSKPKEQVLAERQAALLKALEQNASPREIRQLMAEVKLLEPDAYGTRAAVEGVVDYQQAMKGDKGDGYWDIYTGRADKLPDDTSERFAVLSQEASASLAKMYSHSHGETGNSVSDVLAMAKYLGRIDHAHFEAGLSTSNDPVIDTMRQLMATKANGGSQADTVRVLQEWAQANNLSDLTDQQIQDAWVAQAQALGQDLVVKLRSSEQMAHVFAPKDVNDSSGSGSDSSTPLQSGDSLPDATATSDKTNSAETRNQTDLETLSNTPEKPKDAEAPDSGQSQVGGVRGTDVYPPNTFVKDGTTRISNLNVEKLKKGIGRLSSATYLHDAKVTSAGPGNFTIEVPHPSGSGTINIPVTVEAVSTANLSTPHAHMTPTGGSEAGPARLHLQPNPTGSPPWTAKIQIDSSLHPDDVRIVIGHEINEIAGLVHQNPGGMPVGGMGDQMKASMFTQGSTATAPTAHDRAAALELRTLYEDLRNLEKSGSADKIARRQQSIDRHLEWMGLNDPVNLDAKLKVLREAGLLQEDIEKIERVGARHELDAHRTAEAAGGRSNTIFDEGAVRHLMFAEEQGSFKGSGIYGGHHTQRLLDFVNNHKQYVLEEVASRSAGGTIFRSYKQYRWKDALPKPMPGDSRLPGGADYDPAQWEESRMVKTAADDLQGLMQEANAGWENLMTMRKAANPYAAPPAPAADGTRFQFGGSQPAAESPGSSIHFGGFATYNAAQGRWVVSTVFVEEGWVSSSSP